ncbi:MAG: hypothetical protein ACFFGZ_09455 [Candidatus Thorarchaeota archaeon]
MPFIDIGYETATLILSDTTGSILRELLQSEKINPTEAELLQNLVSLHRGEQQEEAKKRIKEVLEKHTEEEADRAFDRLVKFATSPEKRVSWVLFSRTIQLLPFEKDSPLEGYQPQSVEIIKVVTSEQLVKKII